MDEFEVYDDEMLEFYDDDFYDDESVEMGEDVGKTIASFLAPGLGPALYDALKPKPKPPLPQKPPSPPGQPVTGLPVQTPKGPLHLPLTTGLVSHSEFQARNSQQDRAISMNRTRLNTVTQDVGRVSQQVNAVAVTTRRELAKAQLAQKAALVKLRKQHKAELDKLKKEQSSQAMTDMMFSIISQKQAQKNLARHYHDVPEDVPKGSDEDPAALSSSDNTALMFLPLAMGQGGSGDDNNMMMLIAMVLMSQA